MYCKVKVKINTHEMYARVYGESNFTSLIISDYNEFYSPGLFVCLVPMLM